MDFTCIFFGILFTLAGLWFAFGKGYLHLSLLPQYRRNYYLKRYHLSGKRIFALIFKPLVCICDDCMDDTCRLRYLVYRKEQPIPQTVISIAVLHR